MQSAGGGTHSSEGSTVKTFTQHKIRNYSDRQLLALCREAGQQALRWRRKFIGYLPEVYHRRLYEKKGCSSIFEFGKKMAGLSEAQIRLALNLERRFKDKPALLSALVDGEVSINKLTRIASIATRENDKVLAETAQALSKSSLEVFVRDVRHSQKRASELVELSYTAKIAGLSHSGDSAHTEADGERCGGLAIEGGLNKPQTSPGFLPGQPAEAERRYFEKESKKRRCFGESVENGSGLEFQLSAGVTDELNQLHNKGIDVNQVLMGLLEKREMEIEQQRVEVAEEMHVRESKRKTEGREPSRYVSVQLERVLEREFGTTCAVPNCQKQREHTHHVLPFSMVGSHDPRFMLPLCRAHHDIVHSINTKYVKRKLI